MPVKLKLLVDFNAANLADDSLLHGWKIITDAVMGGCSSGDFRIMATGTACFSGHVSLKNNGGFVTTRAAISQSIDNKYQGIAIRVLGDGNLYSFRIKTSHMSNDIQFKQEFETHADTWQSIKLAFKDFEAVYRGKPINDAPKLIQEEIKELGFLIANKQSGDFSLIISSIGLY